MHICLNRLRRAAPYAMVAATAACASSARSSTEAPAPAPAPEVAPTALSPVIRWTGNLQPVPSRSGYVSAPADRAKAFGSVVLSATPQEATRTRAQITFNIPVQGATEFRWALLPGRCGANTLPLVGFEAFPIIEVGNSGRGQLDVPIPVLIPTEGSYHVNVYRHGQQIDNVVTCANLRREGQR